MYSIQGFLPGVSLLLMKYKHLSQAKRYQIYVLMKAGHDQTQIAKLLDRHKSTISRELIRNTGSRGYRWECDTVIGASHKGAVVTMVERKSGYAVLAKVSNKTSELVSSAIVSNLKHFSVRVKTLTYDNGKEFAGHSLIDQELNSTAYFARPFASWERGSNENLNGLLRQYSPKKRAMSTVNDEEIRMIQNRLNNRPRKRLGFKTPAEVFHQSLKRVALRT